jgi:hypothetical protein
MKKFRNRNVTTLEDISPEQLQNLFNFMKGKDIYMPYQDIQARTGIHGDLMFKITVSNSLLAKITPDVALDAIVSGVLR